MSNWIERIGTPFYGKEREQLIDFLRKQELDYDEQIEYTVVLLDDEQIIATGSSCGNILKCIAVSSEYQGQNLMGTIMTNLISHLYDNGITHFFGFTKPKNKEIFCNMGFYPIAETENILLLENRRNGLKKYIEKLEKETKVAMEVGKANEKGREIGAIIANCNPFTLGHRYLIEQAAKECEWLHVFILSEEQTFLRTKERYELVKKGVQDISNIILHQTSDYLISPVVFPTYFIKDKVNAFTMNCKLDIKIFTESIAKKLGITRRFVGSEPSCAVTSQYNLCLKEELPKNGITVTQLERKTANGIVISASTVRKYIKGGQFEQLESMLPKEVLQYLRGRYENGEGERSFNL
ncbi:MAG: [citrate (pro-3S)-lyase] ligase [Lachnospiraceae bacterium]